VKLEGKIGIVTGAGTGIGAAIAHELSRAGMKLVLNGRRKEPLERVARDCTGAVVAPGDMTEPATAQMLVDTALARFGALHVVINNAGMNEMGPIREINIDRVCRMVRTNVEGAYRMAYVALRQLLKSEEGWLINTGSVVGTKVRPLIGAYAGTKHAVEALTEALRMELAGTNVAVGCISPGLTETELFEGMTINPRKNQNVAKALAPADVARGVRFMLEQPSHVRIARLLMLPAEQGA
jgi:NADP-dependent 3-hydroxy acid dehydrogenase YdfG